jgi:pimeloyl-ACP methyl ester carboxylesterase
MDPVVAHTIVGDPGAPRTLVCHPGGPGMDGSYFGDLGGLAGDALRIVQVHPRGTHGSAAPAGYGLERYADDLDGLREHLGLERLDLLGHSHGGFVAITYAAGRPETTGDLILCCTAPRFGPELAAEAEQAVRRRHAEPWFEDAVAAMTARRARHYDEPRELGELYASEFRLYFNDPADAARLPSTAFDMNALHVFNDTIAPTYDLRPLLPRITARTLVLNGALDFFGPQVSARELGTIERAEVTLLGDAGHFAWIDQPAAFRARLAAFLGL